MLDRVRSKAAYLVIAALLLLLMLLPFEWFLAKYTTLMIFIGLNTMVTVGLCLLMGYTGQVSLGHAAFFGMGAYFSAILSKTYDVNPWLAMFIGAAADGSLRLCYRLSHIQAAGQLPGHGHTRPGGNHLHSLQGTEPVHWRARWHVRYSLSVHRRLRL